MPSGSDAASVSPSPEAMAGQTVGLPPGMVVPTSAPPLAAFGRYEARGVLGSGGFGTVYLGHDPQLARTVAIKVLRGGADVPRAKIDEFLQEARRLAQLSHPGIVAVHDVGVHEGQVYIVSDFLDGGNLSDWLKNNRLSWSEAARIAASVADALAHAHARLTVHRDVKPANIILTRDRTPVVVDFGIGLDETRAAGRELGVVTGTPSYMSPEQVAGEAHRIDGRTDIYSLGVVLYEMLCGRKPFRSKNMPELMRQVLQDEPQPPRQLAVDIPPELERICLKALAKAIHDRYTTAGDFAEDLRRVAQASITTDSAITPSSGQSFVEVRAADTPSSERRAREAERRQVSVLICACDVFESEEYLERTEAEEQANTLKVFHETCEQVVHRFEGHVVQSNEQGFLACFGYPVAYEDAARRAVLTGLGILEGMKAVGAAQRIGLKLELNPWIGIHTGPAVVELGQGAVSLVGEARNVAVRLEGVIAPGQIVCSGSTHRLIQGHFDCANLGQTRIKGMSQPIELFQVREALEDRNRIEVAGQAALTPLTGREHEVSLLKDRWEQVKEGMGQVILLIGEPGLGKSRLVYTLKRHVKEGAEGSGEGWPAPASDRVEDTFVVEWRCSPHYRNTSLYPVSEFFERFLGLRRDQKPAAMFDRLVSHLEELGLATPEIVPPMASLLSLPLDDRFPSLQLSPVRERQETFLGLQEWLRAYCSKRPVLFVVEDLHWVDASTLEFLGQFVAEALDDRVLTLLTFRPEFRTSWPAIAHQTSLALNRLTKRQVADIIRNKTGVQGLPDTLVDQVYDRTGGVPLFVEEFTKMVQESGVLEQAGHDSKRITALIAQEIPATLQDLIMARLERFEGNLEVAQLASALGREFSYELLAAGTTLDEPTLQAELGKLVEAEILYSRGRPPRCSYTFKHALLGDAAYSSLLKGKRQQFHSQIAEALEARFPKTVQTQPEVLAHHFTEAGLTDKGISYWLKAGLRSRERSADVEAIGHLTKGLALLEAVAESANRDRMELELLNPLGTALIAARGYAAPEVGPVFDRARELCERVGQPAQLFAIMRGTFAWHVVRGDFRLCAVLAEEAMSFGGQLEDHGILMEASFLSAVASLYRGDFTGARDHSAKAVSEYDDRERTKFWAAITGEDSGVGLRCYLALALWHLGYPDQALSVNREAIELARTIGHPFSLEYALHHTGWLHQHCRLGAKVQASGEEQIEIAKEQGFLFWQATGTLYRAAGLVLRGQLNGGLPLLLEGIDAYRATGAALALPYYLSLLGDAYTQVAQFAEALQALDEGLAIAEKNDDRFQEAELHRLRGELLLAESVDQAAVAKLCFMRAIESARCQRSLAWELRATMSLARLLQNGGRRDEARRVLADVYANYTEGWSTPDLVDAKAMLDALN